MERLETERLTLRSWRETDYPLLLNFFSNPETSKFVGGIKNEEESWRLLATYIGHLQLKGYSYLAVEEKASGVFVGSVGLWNSEPWPELELGYWLVKEMQGKGYAAEAAGKLLDYARTKLNSKTLVSYIDEENIASIRLAEKLGAHFEGKIDLLQFGEHLVYRYWG